MQEPERQAEATLPLRVGGLSRHDLRAPLRQAGVLLNVHAETLLDHEAFDGRDPEMVHFVERGVADLRLNDGGTLLEVLGAARNQGLFLCPPDTAPYLRLAMTSQANAPDSVLSAGTSPAGAIKVASAPLSDDVKFPKGFYLRVVDNQQWLRGFRCDQEYRFSPEDRFIFQYRPGTARGVYATRRWDGRSMTAS